MADYSKLKVVDLKAELKKRGLPQTGLKQALVDRLSEADTRNAEPINAGEHVKDAPKPADERRDGDPQVVQEKEEEPALEISRVVAEAPTIALEQPPATAGPVDPSSSQPLAQVDDVSMPDAPSKPVDPSSQFATPSAPEVTPAQSTPDSVRKEEVYEDTRKRKRRSQSPPPSSMDMAQKKARQEDGSPRVTLPEDLVPQIGENKLESTTEDIVVDKEIPASSVEQIQTSGDDATKDTTVHDGDEHDVDMENGKESSEGLATLPPGQDSTGEESKVEQSILEKNEEPPVRKIEETTPENSVAAPAKTSPSDTRFKNLFTGSTKRDASPPPQTLPHDDEDRIVTPALHPATSALYIRDFMRPLQPGNLKDHLISIATPPNSSPKQDIVTDFFLDPIRTHCLVTFASISAASRVRSALHDRVWPDERTRKPLWVDFVPDEKVKEWVGIEQDSTSGRGAPTKRWEVVYEQVDQGVQAIFQEIGSGRKTSQINGPRAEIATLDAGKGVQGAPSGPRNDGLRKPPDAETSVRAGANMGFKALDDLFKSTVAKPKLYFLPVAKPLADKRLDKLGALRGGPARVGDEMRRYSFEDGEFFVDKGPEFGLGYRGGYRGRGGGGYSGAYGGRGGGGGRREDSWRSRGGRP